METTRHINYKSDFVLRERFRDGAGNVVGLPEVDFTLRYWVKTGRVYEASRRGDEWNNCVADGDAVLVVFKDHNLGEGKLKHELHLGLDNALMADGVQNVYYPEELNIELWQWRGDEEGVIESDLLAAYTRGAAFTWDDFTEEQLAQLKGEKGEPFRWEDFTPAQIVELKRPATEAAETANEAATRAEKAAKAADEGRLAVKEAGDKAVASCNSAAESARQEATRCASATQGAAVAAAEANAAAAQAEASRQKVETMAEQIEAAASMIPTGLRVDSPGEITIGNPVARYIAAKVKPDYVEQNVLYLSDGTACDVEPDGRIVARRAGVSRVHVIPTAGTRHYKTVEVAVVPPRLRLAGSALRLDREGNIRLT